MNVQPTSYALQDQTRGESTANWWKRKSYMTKMYIPICLDSDGGNQDPRRRCLHGGSQNASES